MLSNVSLTGKDTIILDSRIMKNLADGDAASVEYPNDLVAMKKGKDGSAIYAFNETGAQVNVNIRVVRGSADDKYLNSRLQEQKNDFSSFILFTGEFVKRVGDGAGNVTSDIYKMEGGAISKIPAVKTNVEGDTEQSVAIYTIMFANTDRALS